MAGAVRYISVYDKELDIILAFLVTDRVYMSSTCGNRRSK